MTATSETPGSEAVATEPGEGPPGATKDFVRIGRTAAERIRSNSRLRRNLPGDGRLELDRALPFLFVYRDPPARRDPGTPDLVTGFSAYLLSRGDESFREGLAGLVACVADTAREELGEFLLFEVWSAEEGDGVRPSVTVVLEEDAPEAVEEKMGDAMRRLRIEPGPAGTLGVPDRLASVEVRRGDVAPPGMRPISLETDGDGPLHRVGLEVAPFFRHPVTMDPYPRVLQAFRAAFTDRLEEVLFDFALERTSLDPPHPRALARRHVGRAARHVDRRLGEAARSFDTLLQVTPVNTEEAWRAFVDGGCSQAPELRYRPLPFDPEHLKRRLFNVPIENVEDPLLAFLFREKQEELDRQITMLREIETDRFCHASVSLYGGVAPDLVELAEEILGVLEPPSADGGREEYLEEDDRDAGSVDAVEFAEAARQEIDWYRRQTPAFEADVEIRPDVTAGLMVTSGVLCVGEGLRIPRNRMQALINHEVGTHLVTWWNGARQPIRQFQTGLAGYDSLQEGIAVLSEYLMGGLTPGRLRILAGRVVGVRSLLSGADFMETYRLLREGYGFGARAAFIVTVRIHRGGGLTKDAAYLRGLRDLLAYLRADGALDPLFVGKLGLAHAEVVQELVLRGVLTLPAVKPRYTSDLAAMERLGGCRRMDVMDLVERVSAPGSQNGSRP